MSWKRIALYAIALNFIFFFRGCDRSGNVDLTSGAFVPFLTIQIDDDGVQRGLEVLDFSFPLLILNLAVALGLLAWIKRRCPKFDAFLARRAILIIAGAIFALFNLVLIPNPVWAYTVFWPTAYIQHFLASFFYTAEPGSPPVALIDFSARLYFLFVLSLLSLFPLLADRFRRKVSPVADPSPLPVSSSGGSR